MIWSPSSKRMVAAVSEPDPPRRLLGYYAPELATENWDEIGANARLIAAAPELLEILSLWVALHDEGMKSRDHAEQMHASGMIPQTVAAAKAAIARATGSQP